MESSSQNQVFPSAQPLSILDNRGRGRESSPESYQQYSVGLSGNIKSLSQQSSAFLDGTNSYQIGLGGVPRPYGYSTNRLDPSYDEKGLEGGTSRLKSKTKDFLNDLSQYEKDASLRNQSQTRSRALTSIKPSAEFNRPSDLQEDKYNPESMPFKPKISKGSREIIAANATYRPIEKRYKEDIQNKKKCIEKIRKKLDLEKTKKEKEERLDWEKRNCIHRTGNNEVSRSRSKTSQLKSKGKNSSTPEHPHRFYRLGSKEESLNSSRQEEGEESNRIPINSLPIYEKNLKWELERQAKILTQQYETKLDTLPPDCTFRPDVSKSKHSKRRPYGQSSFGGEPGFSRLDQLGFSARQQEYNYLKEKRLQTASRRAHKETFRPALNHHIAFREKLSRNILNKSVDVHETRAFRLRQSQSKDRLKGIYRKEREERGSQGSEESSGEEEQEEFEFDGGENLDISESYNQHHLDISENLEPDTMPPTDRLRVEESESPKMHKKQYDYIDQENSHRRHGPPPPYPVPKIPLDPVPSSALNMHRESAPRSQSAKPKKKVVKKKKKKSKTPPKKRTVASTSPHLTRAKAKDRALVVAVAKQGRPGGVVLQKKTAKAGRT